MIAGYMHFYAWNNMKRTIYTRTPETNLLCFLLRMGRVPFSISIWRKKNKTQNSNNNFADVKTEKWRQKTQLVKQLHLWCLKICAQKTRLLTGCRSFTLILLFIFIRVVLCHVYMRLFSQFHLRIVKNNNLMSPAFIRNRINVFFFIVVRASCKRKKRFKNMCYI